MKNLFIGIDFSKKTIDVSFFSRDEMDTVYYDQFENTREGYQKMYRWIKSIGKYKPSEWLFCGEHTGLYSIGLSEYLASKKLFLWLENPLQIKLSSGIKREKSDKADSKAIALYCYRFEDKAVAYEPKDKDIRQLSLLLAFRERLKRNKQSLLVSAAEMRAVMQRNPMARYVYEQSYGEVRQIHKKIKEVEKKMLEIIEASEELCENYHRVTSIKGIALINAVVFIIHTANFTRFETARQLACYAGAAPFGKTSGTSVKSPKRISNLANRQMKVFLTQAARSAVQHDPPLREYYLRKIGQGKNERLVLNNVRNKLVHRIFAVVKNKTVYQTNYKLE